VDLPARESGEARSLGADDDGRLLAGDGAERTLGDLAESRPASS